jgi:3-keto-disaccharide hydrolase
MKLKKRQIPNAIAIISFAICLFYSIPAFAGSGLHVIRPITTDLKLFKLRGPSFISKWIIGRASINPDDPEKLLVTKSNGDGLQLVNTRSKGVDIFTRQQFGDCTVEMEVMVPQGSNSGIYLTGLYEVQIKDSFGKSSAGTGDMGGIIRTASPRVNAAGKPGEWQRFLIEFKTPRFNQGNRVSPATFVKVMLNGQLIHENVFMNKGPTSGAFQEEENAKGPLMLQGGLGSVAFRNINITTRER